MDKSRTLRANKKLAFSSSDSDGPTKERNCDEIHDTPNPRTDVKKLRDVEKKKHVKRPQKRIVSPVKQIIVKKTPKTVGQTKIKSRVDKEASKFCSPVLTFLASLSGMYTVCQLPQAVVVCLSIFRDFTCIKRIGSCLLSLFVRDCGQTVWFFLNDN
jgi:hypothetical protein